LEELIEKEKSPNPKNGESKKLKSWVSPLFFPFFALFGLLIATASILYSNSIFFDIQRAEKWIPTTGEISEISTEKVRIRTRTRSSRTSHYFKDVPVIHYSFEADGINFKGTYHIRPVSSDMFGTATEDPNERVKRLPPKEKIEVHYDPEDPANSTIANLSDEKKFAWFHAVVGCGFLIGSGFCFLGMIFGKFLKQKKQDDKTNAYSSLSTFIGGLYALLMSIQFIAYLEKSLSITAIISNGIAILVLIAGIATTIQGTILFTKCILNPVSKE